MLYDPLQRTATAGFVSTATAASTTAVQVPSYATHFTKLFNLSKPTGYVMHQQFNIQQLYVLPTVYLCVLYLSENKQRLVLLIS